MSSIVKADLSKASMEAEERRVGELRAKCDALRAQFEAAEEEYVAAKTQLEWRRILTFVQEDSLLQAAFEKLRKATAQFEHSLETPEGFEAENDLDYTVTDDYGDISLVETVVDTVVNDAIAELAAGNHKRACHMLLIVSTQVGGLFQKYSAKSPEIKGLHINIHELEELRDELVLEWQKLLYCEEDCTLGGGALPLDLAIEWQAVVATHLGSPFDSKPSV